MKNLEALTRKELFFLATEANNSNEQDLLNKINNEIKSRDEVPGFDDDIN